MRRSVGALGILTVIGAMWSMIPQQVLVAQAADSVVARAQRLMTNGDASAARALMDSLIAHMAPESPEYADALYWHATLSGTAAQAEKDYLLLSIEYPLSARAPEALFRLAQLEKARADRALATRHLQRLLREHPNSPYSGRGAFDLAQMLFEQNDAPRGCGALAIARAAIAATDVEQVNRVDYFAARCTQVTAIAPYATDSVIVTDSATTTATPPSRSGAGARGATSGGRGAGGRSGPAAARGPGRVQTPPARPPAPARAYSVQVASFNRRDQADALNDALAQRGYQARVWGDAPPFRVRVGRFASRADADTLLARMESARVMTKGMVVEAEPES